MRRRFQRALNPHKHLAGGTLLPSAVVLAEPEVLQLLILRHSVDKPYQGSHSLGKAAAGQQECVHTSMPTYVRPLELPCVHRECLSLLNATRNPGVKMQSDLQEVLQVSCCTCSYPTTGWQHGSRLRWPGTAAPLHRRAHSHSLRCRKAAVWGRKAGWKRYGALFHTFL